MSLPNPTPVRIGMSGIFAGRRYHVAGRLVMAMDDAGETWRWNEFHLVSDTGESATLVYEDSEGPVQWKLFTLFEPRAPLSVEEASRRQVDDRIDLDGTPARVSLVDESRVESIEGQAPEGVTVGDVARYFNAETGNGMFVVSWTGDEVEYYRGINLPTRAVYSAFGLDSLPAPPAQDPFAATPATAGPGATLVKIVLAVAALALVMLGFRACKSRPSPTFNTTSPGTALAAPAPPPPAFLPGTNIDVAGSSWQVSARRFVEVQTVHRSFVRHEYLLAATGTNAPSLQRRWLIGSPWTETQGWRLCELLPSEQAPALDPFQAAALRTGTQLPVDGQPARVLELFRISVLRVEPEGAWPGCTPGSRRFGFSASLPPETSSSGHAGRSLIATWDEHAIDFALGDQVRDRDVQGR